VGDLAVQVLTAVGERDAAVASAERRAGAALAAMTGTDPGRVVATFTIQPVRRMVSISR